VDKAKSGDTLYLNGKHPYYEYNIKINKDLTIKGPTTTGTPTAVVDGKGSEEVGTIFVVNPGVTLNVKYLTLRNAINKLDYGGAICNNKGTVSVTNCQFSTNNGDYYGGGIYNYKGTLKVSNSVFYQNTAFSSGGAIDNVNGFLTVTNCKFMNNHANHGGGICSSGEMTITGCQFTNNTATWGAGIMNTAKMTVSYCEFKGNEAPYGDAIRNFDGDTTNRKVKYCSFRDTYPGFDNVVNEIYSDTGFVNAENNWWGSNDDPSARIYGDVDVSPWIMDTTGAPKFSSSIPKSGATKVARNSAIKVTFNEYVKTGSSFFIELKTSSGTIINITKSLSGKVLTIKPTSKLAANTKYTVYLHTGCVTDYLNNKLTVKTFSFTTGSS
jgi:predicted outer membrane repeat protein